MKVWKKSILDEVIGLTQAGQKVEGISEKDIERLGKYIEEVEETEIVNNEDINKDNNEEIEENPEEKSEETIEQSDENKEPETDETEEEKVEIPAIEELEKMEMEELKELAKRVKIRGVVDSFKDKVKLIESINKKR